MKIALREAEGISILDVSGEIDPHNFQVLKAGLSKLLKVGKNRIALHFVDADKIAGELLREIAILDVFARELSGQIILVSSNQQMKDTVRTFAKPPVIPILSSVELAVDYFKKALSDEEEGAESAADLKKELDARAKRIAALEAQIKQLDPKEILKLRAANAELVSKVKLLEGQVEDFIRRQRDPVEAEGFLEKISALEDSVKKLSAGAGAAK